MERKSILLVDDDRAILESLSEILRLNGYAVDTAESGQEAIYKSEMNYYNLAIIDIKLGDMDGTELLAKLRGGEPETVKIMLTGFPTLDNAVDAVNKGADAYIMKPADPKELLRTVSDRLLKQEQDERLSEKRVAKWIQRRVDRLKQAKSDVEL